VAPQTSMKGRARPTRRPRQVRLRMPRLLRRPGHLLCRDLERRRTRLPVDIRRYLRKVGFAKLYDRKTPLTAADLLNDRVIPFYEEHDIPLQCVLTDRGTEYCRTKAKSPQTNGIVERFHKTMLDEFYRIAFRKKLYETIEDLQADLDLWMREFNEARPHQGKWCFLDALPLARENPSSHCGRAPQRRMTFNGQPLRQNKAGSMWLKSAGTQRAGNAEVKCAEASQKMQMMLAPQNNIVEIIAGGGRGSPGETPHLRDT
jgi:hypothetical protein